MNDLRHSCTTAAFYRTVAVLKKDGLKCYIIVNTAEGQGQALTVAFKVFSI